MTNKFRGYVYLKVTNDKYELPLVVADSPSELAKIIGTTRNTISCGISKGSKTFKKVYIGVDE